MSCVNGDTINFQGPSPDEIALVEFAQNHGYEFWDGNQSKQVVRRRIKNNQGQWEELDKMQFTILRKIEFNSDRKRMSIVVKDHEDGFNKLYIKGADNIIKERLSTECYMNIEPTTSFIHKASIKGYRTLLIGMKILSDEEVA